MRVLGATVPLLVALASAPALAQSDRPPAAGWQFEVAPYLWGAGIDGEMRIGAQPATAVEASFSDLLAMLDIGGMLAFEGRKGRAGFVVDAIYLELSDDAPAPNPALGTVEADMTQQYYTLAGTYRVLQGNVDLDVVAGVRYTDMKIDLALSGGAVPPRSGSQGESFWDGIVGARVRYHPGKHWTIAGYLDVGTGGSDLSWQFVGGASYAFNDLVALGFGYRHLDQDFETEEFAYDAALAGPYLGVMFRF